MTTNNLHSNFIRNCQSIKSLVNSKVRSIENINQVSARSAEARVDIRRMKEYWLKGCENLGKDNKAVQNVYQIYTDMVDMLTESLKANQDSVINLGRK